MINEPFGIRLLFVIKRLLGGDFRHERKIEVILALDVFDHRQLALLNRVLLQFGGGFRFDSFDFQQRSEFVRKLAGGNSVVLEREILFVELKFDVVALKVVAFQLVSSERVKELLHEVIVFHLVLLDQLAHLPRLPFLKDDVFNGFQ